MKVFINIVKFDIINVIYIDLLFIYFVFWVYIQMYQQSRCVLV